MKALEIAVVTPIHSKKEIDVHGKVRTFEEQFERKADQTMEERIDFLDIFCKSRETENEENHTKKSDSSPSEADFAPSIL
jgi:hypothetical protein